MPKIPRPFQRRWLGISFVIWLVLVAATALLANRDEYVLVAAKEALAPLAAGLGSVVVAGLLLDRYQERVSNEQAAVEQTEWLRRNHKYVSACHGAMRVYLSQVVTFSYSVFACFYEESKVVPPQYLRYDVALHPGHGAHTRASVRPLGLAREQAAKVLPALPADMAWKPGPLGVAWLLLGGPDASPGKAAIGRPSVTAKSLATARARAHESYPKLKTAADRLAALSGDLVSLGLHEPVELRGAAVRLQAATAELGFALAHDGSEPADRVRTLAPAATLLGEAQHISRRVSDHATELLEQARNWAEGDPRGVWTEIANQMAKSLAPGVAAMVGTFSYTGPDETEWRAWLTERGIEFTESTPSADAG